MSIHTPRNWEDSNIWSSIQDIPREEWTEFWEEFLQGKNNIEIWEYLKMMNYLVSHKNASYDDFKIFCGFKNSLEKLGKISQSQFNRDVFDTGTEELWFNYQERDDVFDTGTEELWFNHQERDDVFDTGTEELWFNYQEIIDNIIK